MYGCLPRLSMEEPLIFSHFKDGMILPGSMSFTSLYWSPHLCLGISICKLIILHSSKTHNDVGEVTRESEEQQRVAQSAADVCWNNLMTKFSPDRGAVITISMVIIGIWWAHMTAIASCEVNRRVLIGDIFYVEELDVLSISIPSSAAIMWLHHKFISWCSHFISYLMILYKWSIVGSGKADTM